MRNQIPSRVKFIISGLDSIHPCHWMCLIQSQFQLPMAQIMPKGALQTFTSLTLTLFYFILFTFFTKQNFYILTILFLKTVLLCHNPPASAFQVAGITGAYHCNQFIFPSLLDYCHLQVNTLYYYPSLKNKNTSPSKLLLGCQ